MDVMDCRDGWPFKKHMMVWWVQVLGRKAYELRKAMLADELV
jgi:hypothetical protein